MHILTAQEMQWVDQQTTAHHEIPSLDLMENAATRVVEFIAANCGDPRGRLVLIACGKGNNGGDGAAAARLLVARGAEVDMWMLAPVQETKGDARANFERAGAIANQNPHLRVRSIQDPSGWETLHERLPLAWLILDALLGTGTERPATGPYAQMIEEINRTRQQRGTPVLSVDIPSGLSADADQLIGPAIAADYTVTFTAPKPAVVLPPACYQAGRVEVVSIGSPPSLLEALHPQLHFVEAADARGWLRSTRRTPAGHKGTYGHALIIGGSRGKIGAAVLAAEAALRAGAGLVTVATVGSQQSVPSSVHPEIMVEGFSETSEGTLESGELQRLQRLEEGRDLVAVGPGLGTHAATQALVHGLVLGRRRRMIIDADGLNCVSPWADDMDDVARPLVLTPHPAEMARLINAATPDVLSNRVGVARSFAQEHQLYLVLKGHRSLVATPDGDVFVNPTGNAALATAGSGDVLTGVLAGFLAAPAADLATGVIAAVYLHGLAGELAAKKFGLRGVMASDVTAHLAEAIRITAGEEGEF